MSRTCLEIKPDGLISDHSIPLSDLSEVPAWVLLGEPGLGKTTVFKELGHGNCIAARDLCIYDDLNANQTYFIDALDEANNFLDVRNKLAKQKISRIRLSCRAADWHSANLKDFQTLYPKLRVFLLEPFNELAITDYLTTQLNDSALVTKLLNQTKEHGLYIALGNPQHLNMIIRLSKADQFPKNKTALFELVCKDLLKEQNVQHQSQASSVSENDLLTDAGYVATLYLLSHAHGVTLGANNENGANQSALADLHCMQLENNQLQRINDHLLKKPLFQTISNKGYDFIHRSYAEYLAAQYLSKKLHEKNLSEARLLSLLLANDGGVVSNLRGLVGQLSSSCAGLPIAKRLITAAPLAVLHYADLSAFSEDSQRSLLDCIKKLTYVSYISKDMAKGLAPLVSKSMQACLKNYISIEHPTQQDGGVAYLILHALAAAELDESQRAFWLPLLDTFIRMPTWQDDTRRVALSAYTQLASPASLLALTSDIGNEKVHDENSNLLGDLLESLYPQSITPKDVFQYWGRNRKMYIGSYHLFWHDLFSQSEQCNDANLMQLMDGLTSWCAQASPQEQGNCLPFYKENLSMLAATAISRLGHNVEISQLCVWIDSCWINFARSGNITIEATNVVRLWAEQQQATIKKLFAYKIFNQTNFTHALNVLFYHELKALRLDSNTCEWFLGLADQALIQNNLSAAIFCLTEAMQASITAPESTTLAPECLAEWVTHRPQLQASYQEVLVKRLEPEEWHQHNQIYAEEAAAAQNARETELQKDLAYLRENIQDLADGKILNALDILAHHLLFAPLLKNDLLHAVQSDLELNRAMMLGFENCLATVTSDKIDAALNARLMRKTINIERSCLIAAQQLFENDLIIFNELSQLKKSALLTFFFLNHQNSKPWSDALMIAEPAIAAKQYLLVVTTELKLKTEHIWFLNQIIDNEIYSPIAEKILPELLSIFPTKLNKTQLSNFKTLLLGCWKHIPARQLLALLERRLLKKSLTAIERGYCLLTGLLVAPDQYAQRLDELFLLKELAVLDLAGFADRFNAHQYSAGKLAPALNLNAANALARLFGPHCSPEADYSFGYMGSIDFARDLVKFCLSRIAAHDSEDAGNALQALLQQSTLAQWHSLIQWHASQHREQLRESHASKPTAVQIATMLRGDAPASHADLLAVVKDAISDYQEKIHGSELNYRQPYWKDNSKHANEDECRNEICRYLVGHLQIRQITLALESLHANQKRSDIQLQHLLLGGYPLRLPIEVKGDWHPELWTAPEKQLLNLYMNHPECGGLGLYLVIWTGCVSSAYKIAYKKSYPNGVLPTSAVQLYAALNDHIHSKANCNKITLFVLDVSLPSKSTPVKKCNTHLNRC